MDMMLERLQAYVLLLCSFVFKLIPIKAKRFYFCSFHGQYSDSPRRISEQVHETIENAELIWEISDKCREPIPDYIVAVPPSSLKSVFYRSSSRVIVDNYFGWSYGYSNSGSLRYKVLSKQKKKGQLNISTWHGTGFKKVALDMPEYQGKDLSFYSTSDLITVNCRFNETLFHHLTQDKVPIRLYGTPRNDLLFNADSSLILQIKEKLHLPLNNRIVLYAPTFRDGDTYMSGISQLEKMNVERLLLILKEKFGGDWTFVFRAHDSVFQKLEKELCRFPENIMSGNIGDDMGEYLVVSDMLITDYSSSLFDYLYTNRPSFLLCPDYNHYMQIERGLYFSSEDLPCPVAECADDLYRFIMNFDNQKYNQDVKDFLNRMGSVEDGMSAGKIVSVILNELCMTDNI